MSETYSVDSVQPAKSVLTRRPLKRCRESPEESPAPLGEITANQLHQLLGSSECHTTRKRAVDSSVSGLRRSRTFTAADTGRRAKPVIPVLRSSCDVSHVRAVTSANGGRTAGVSAAPACKMRAAAVADMQSLPTSSTGRNICPPRSSQSSSTSVTTTSARTGAGPGQAGAGAVGGVSRVPVAKTAGRTPPRLGRSLSFSRKKKSSSLQRMSSLRSLESVDAERSATSSASSASQGPDQFVVSVSIWVTVLVTDCPQVYGRQALESV